jgi:molecular chaperone IbpA
MLNYDFSPLFRSTVGFDRIMSLLDSATSANETGYPPYNIEKTGEDKYKIVLAVAGFGEDDLSIEQKEGTLTITGRKPQEQNATYLHRGLASRYFERRFELADHVKVAGAGLQNGLLEIELVREVPEALKPRRIAIGTGAKGGPKLVEGEKAEKAA